MTQFIRSSKKEAMNFLRYIGPGLLVTVGFIDPGNWASNIAAGSGYGYTLLWMVTLSTIMLVILQHNAAHLGIVTGKCLSEATSLYINKRLKNTIINSSYSIDRNSNGRTFRRGNGFGNVISYSSKDWYVYHFRNRVDVSVYKCLQQN